MNATVLARLTLALDRCDDEIERLWELPFREACDEWTRLQAQRLGIERVLRRLGCE